ncbi:LysR family transcriptional regulator [Inquilinus limosus]|uniref:LysR family transcriptional regulator n=1 Tax=Inquilinus limosus TaxID=171674 RepID=UPI003F1521ED
MDQPDFKAIKYVVAVAEHLSFRRAADALRIRQSAVSRQVRKLEEVIGVALFERYSGGLRLTHAGRTFIRDARCILMLLDQAVGRADRNGRAEAGLLTLGFFPSLVSGPLKEALQRFRRLSPGILIETMEGSPVDQLQWLRARRIDAGVLAGGYEASDLKQLPLWEEQIFAALPQDHELAGEETLNWQDLRREHWLVRTFESGAVVYNFLIGRIAADGHIPATSLHLTSRENVLGLVGAGYGVTIVPETLVGLNFPGVVFRPITGEGALLPISAAWLGNNDNPALRRFLSLLRQVRTPPPR